MKQLEIKQKKFSNYLYEILLISTFLSFYLVDNIERNSIGLRIITLLLLINLYFFIKIRSGKETFNREKKYSLLATAVSIWFFLHCFLYINSTFVESISYILTLIGLRVNLNYEVFSFFIANLFYLVVAIIEIKKCKSDDRPIYITGIILTSYILLNYIVMMNYTIFDIG